jgi:hypothetical protein
MELHLPTFERAATTKRLQPILDQIAPGCELKIWDAERPTQEQLTAQAHKPIVSVNGKIRSLTSGEVGYRLSMQGIMERFLAATSPNTAEGKQLFLVDDDVRFHKDFKELYADLDSYCLDGLSSGYGVLKLQTAIWHKGTFPNTRLKNSRYIGGWNLIDHEQEMTGSKCYSGHYAVMGSAAVIYARASLYYILDWLKTGPQLPYDHVFSVLAHKGIAVRVAEPGLAVMQIQKASSIDSSRDFSDSKEAERIRKLHRWNTTKYFPYNSTQPQHASTGIDFDYIESESSESDELDEPKSDEFVLEFESVDTNYQL